jgi:hypothetical protein
MRKFLSTYLPASLLLFFLAMILWTCGSGGGIGSGTSNTAVPADVAPGVVIHPTATIGNNPVIGTGTIINKVMDHQIGPDFIFWSGHEKL